MADDAALHSAAAQFVADSRSVSQARHFVEDTLDRWRMSDEWSWSAGLVVTELVTNAVIHAATGFSVRVSGDADALRIEVADGSGRRPRPKRYGTDATTGRGLALVESVAADWGVQPSADGKTVWVVLRPGGAFTVFEPDLDAFSDDVAGASMDRSAAMPSARVPRGDWRNVA